MSGSKAATVQSIDLAPVQHPCHCVDSKDMEIVAQVAVPQSQRQQAEARQRSPRQAPQANVNVLMQPDLQRLVRQVEAVTVDQPANFDAFLQLLHEYQAGIMEKEHFEKQVSSLLALLAVPGFCQLNSGSELTLSSVVVAALLSCPNLPYAGALDMLYIPAVVGEEGRVTFAVILYSMAALHAVALLK